MRYDDDDHEVIKPPAGSPEVRPSTGDDYWRILRESADEGAMADDYARERRRSEDQGWLDRMLPEDR